MAGVSQDCDKSVTGIRQECDRSVTEVRQNSSAFMITINQICILDTFLGSQKIHFCGSFQKNLHLWTNLENHDALTAPAKLSLMHQTFRN